MKRSLSYWQLAGYVFSAVAGTLLHFVYDWAGQSLPAALLSAVNESIWEHMKLLYVPMLVFALIESRFLAKSHRNFWCVKLAGFGLGLGFIPVLYYTYTGILGYSADWFNIAIFFLAAAGAYLLETRILQKHRPCHLSSTVAIAWIIGIGVLFLLFTFFPPHIPLFQDPVTATYGIPA